MAIDDKDIRWDIYTNASPDFSIRATHLPTGHVVSATSRDGEKSQFRMKEKLRRELETKVAAD